MKKTKNIITNYFIKRFIGCTSENKLDITKIETADQKP